MSWNLALGKHAVAMFHRDLKYQDKDNYFHIHFFTSPQHDLKHLCEQNAA